MLAAVGCEKSSKGNPRLEPEDEGLYEVTKPAPKITVMLDASGAEPRARLRSTPPELLRHTTVRSLITYTFEDRSV